MGALAPSGSKWPRVPSTHLHAETGAPGRCLQKGARRTNTPWDWGRHGGEPADGDSEGALETELVPPYV